MTEWRVRLADPAAEMAEVREEVLAAVTRVLDSGRYVLGPEVEAFEREIAAYCNCSHAVGVSSGTDALLATLMALGVGPGDEVITTPFSFIATAMAIVRLGARPVFVDIEPDGFLIDPRGVAAAVTRRTKAIVPVHLFGERADLEAIAAAAPGIPIVEDAAQALGVGRHTGLAACFSFYPTKNLGGAGDGGMVVTDDAELAARLRRVRSHGQIDRFVAGELGGNFRLDEMQAAILRVKLRHLDRWTEVRRRNAALYRALFAERRIDPELLRLPDDARSHVWHHFVVRSPRREAIRAHLECDGIESGVYYPTALHLQAPVAAPKPMPCAERRAGEVLSIPVHAHVAIDPIERVAGHVVTAAAC
jgi:dTDP-4-amino-4,6-dideoxygalactose transaminase